MGQITVRETSDEVRSCEQIRTRRFGVEIEDIQGTASTSAEISYCYYVDVDDSVFNPKDISMDDGDMDIYDLVVAEITKQLEGEGFTQTKQRFT